MIILRLTSARLLNPPLHRSGFPPPSLIPPRPLVFRILGFRFRRLSCCCAAGGGGGGGGGGGCGGGSMGAPPMEVRDRIDLTEKEEKIFQRLLDVVYHFQLGTQLRVAGGWVRDKLLGKDCYDIDIALDNMLGREFCGKLNEYLNYVGEEEQGIGVIQCNPDQSKHLETARMHIYGTWIDFVNLRSETYAENSRIPAMKFGTAEEDAYRRDLTINSMFYNINTSAVEDFTGRGLGDLKEGRIVTPLPPKATFLDDPLRVLRAIRFGARFNFVMDENLKKAASDEEVKAAIADKISRERIGHEIDLMISGNQPVKAMGYICELKLFNAVFSLPENPQPPTAEGCDRLYVQYINAAWDIFQKIALMDCSAFSDEQRRLYLYGALFLPLRNVIYMDKKSKKIPVSSYIFRNSLKLKASDADTVASLHGVSERFVSLIQSLESDGNSEIGEEELSDLPQSSKRRIFAGLLLREIKEFWRVGLMISTLLYHKIDNAGDFLSGHLQSDRINKFTSVESAIIELGLDNIWKIKPLLDGKEIMGVLRIETGGREVRVWQEKLVKWQLAHPQGTAEEALDWMKKQTDKQSEAKRAKLEISA